MFKKHIEELILKEKSVEEEIQELEDKLKTKKFEYKDIKSAVMSLTKLQDKYVEETSETASFSI